MQGEHSNIRNTPDKAASGVFHCDLLTAVNPKLKHKNVALRNIDKAQPHTIEAAPSHRHSSGGGWVGWLYRPLEASSGYNISLPCLIACGVEIYVSLESLQSKTVVIKTSTGLLAG